MSLFFAVCDDVGVFGRAVEQLHGFGADDNGPVGAFGFRFFGGVGIIEVRVVVHQGDIDDTLVHVPLGEARLVIGADAIDRLGGVFYPAAQRRGACFERTSPSEFTVGAVGLEVLAGKKVTGGEFADSCKTYKLAFQLDGGAAGMFYIRGLGSDVLLHCDGAVVTRIPEIIFWVCRRR